MVRKSCSNTPIKKKKKVLITSTSEVYGKSTSVPFREDQDLVLGPTTKGRWSYACSKAIDEFLAIAYWHEKRLPIIIVRLFNTVGPRQTGRYGMVIPNFVQQALNGHPISVYGNGCQSRAFGLSAMLCARSRIWPDVRRRWVRFSTWGIRRKLQLMNWQTWSRR